MNALCRCLLRMARGVLPIYVVNDDGYSISIIPQESIIPFVLDVGLFTLLFIMGIVPSICFDGRCDFYLFGSKFPDL